MQARAVIIYSIQKTRNARTATACRGSGAYGYKEVRRHVHLLGKGLGSTRNQLPRCPAKSHALNGRCALAADGFWRATFQARVDIATPSRFPGENGSSRPIAVIAGPQPAWAGEEEPRSVSSCPRKVLHVRVTSQGNQGVSARHASEKLSWIDFSSKALIFGNKYGLTQHLCRTASANLRFFDRFNILSTPAVWTLRHQHIGADLRPTRQQPAALDRSNPSRYTQFHKS
jgi:hypothetical protein